MLQLVTAGLQHDLTQANDPYFVMFNFSLSFIYFIHWVLVNTMDVFMNHPIYF